MTNNSLWVALNLLSFGGKTHELGFEPLTFGKPIERSHHSSTECSLGNQPIYQATLAFALVHSYYHQVS